MKFIIAASIIILFIVIQVLFQIVSADKNKRIAVGIIFGALYLINDLYFFTLPVPSITPYGQVLSPNQEEITIENSNFSPIYYSLDSNVDPREGQRYIGPIPKSEFPELPFTIAARSILRFGPFYWESERTEQSFRAPGLADGRTEGDTPDESTPARDENANTGSTTVSSQKTLHDGAFPDGIVAGWGDDGGGRKSYTIREINDGALGDQIIFNTISDSVMGNEKNFVGARVNDGIDAGEDHIWQGNLIEVEEGKTYYIRMYCHNNSPWGYDAVAEDVSARFLIPSGTGRTIVVNGMFQSSNATPKTYWDSVVLTADQPFHLKYLPGSAQLENNGIGGNGGFALSDGIAAGEWTHLGYNVLDGKIPGCYQYDLVLTIQVTPVFES